MTEETDPISPVKLDDCIWMHCEPCLILEENNIKAPDFLNFDKFALIT